MGTITTGTGLISGIDYASLIDQLIQIESGSVKLVENRNTVLTAQQTALQDVNAKLLALKFSTDSLTTPGLFNSSISTSSNESVLTVTSGSGAVPGNYNFTVDKLVSSQQVLTKGFKDTDDTSIGSGILTFDKGNSRLDSNTKLSDLNGGNGVTRGIIRVTDRSGAVGLIDLSRAVTINDVIEAVNSATNVSVRATVTGDGLTITDNTGLSSGDLTITNAGITETASSLGIAGTSATGAITGSQINYVGEDTLLSSLNDGQGIYISDSQAEFSITDGASNSFNVDLLNETTLGEVIDTINAASTTAGAGVTASIAADGVSIELTDSNGGGVDFKITPNGTFSTAADLGLSGADDDGDGVINGSRMVANINSKLLSKLNGGQGIGEVRVLSSSTALTDLFDGAGVTTSGNGLRELVIFDRTGASYTINLDPSSTAGDLISLVNTATSGNVTLSISDNSFVLTDNTGGTGNLRAYDNPGSGSTIIADLGLTVNAAVDSVTGTDTFPVATVPGSGTISIQDRDGVSFNVDLSSASSVSDVLTGINDASEAAGAGITASLNRAGNGILLEDSTGGSGDIVVADVDATTAAVLGIAGTFSDDEIDSGNLQYAYLNEGTLLDTIDFVSGDIKITDSTGRTETISFKEGESTIAEILQDINGKGLAINARVNDNGDGIILEDTNTGSLVNAIKVEESGSSTARSLGLLGEATTAGEDLNGSFETTIEYVSDSMDGTTLLSALNSGNGIDFNDTEADIKITTAEGTEYEVDITNGTTTVQDLIDAIETATDGHVSVTFNGESNRLLFTDDTSGSGELSFEAINNSEALSDIGFKLKSGSDYQSNKLVESTTLEDLADLINESNAGVTASIINDGSNGTPYRLIFSADETGSAGAFVFDDGGSNFKATTFSEAQDAVVFFGSTNPALAQVITSTSNTLEDVVPGSTITLLSTSDSPVQVTISEDDGAVTTAAQSFVTSFNNLMTTIDSYDSYDSENEERGLLLGDSAVVQLKNRLFSILTRRTGDLSGSFTSLAEVGLTVGSGGTLRLDANKFANAMQSDRDAVKNLFTFIETETDDEGEVTTTAQGVGKMIDALLERLTDSEYGIIETRVASIQSQIDLNEDRIDRLNEQLEEKRARLEREFAAMETALASIQEQSSSLNTLASLASSTSS